MVPLNYYLILSAIVFAIGVVGVLIRRNLIVVLMSIELMLNAVNLTFIAFARHLGSMEEGGVDGKSFRQAPYVYVAIALALVGTIYLGVLPASALDWSRIAFASLE